MSTAPFSLSGKARDLNVQVRDSCNCCCFQWKRNPSPNTPVFVSKSGLVERYDREKAQSEIEALQSTIANLREIISEQAIAHQRDVNEIMTLLKSHNIILEQRQPQIVTIQTINIITQILRAP